MRPPPQKFEQVWKFTVDHAMADGLPGCQGVETDEFQTRVTWDSQKGFEKALGIPKVSLVPLRRLGVRREALGLTLLREGTLLKQPYTKSTGTP